MAIKTMAANSGGGTWSEGWHTLTISKAEYGDWNGKTFIDVWFEGYPDKFNIRTFSATNKETHEEFSISRLFKLANAGIIDKITSPNGKEAIQYDDDVEGLTGKVINVLFYKVQGDDKEFIKASDRIAPVKQEGKIISYSDKDVEYYKGLAQKHYDDFLSKQSSAPTKSESSSEANIPF